jgi:tripartite-type tricarboxylate transporter receptor subunit TctC
MVVNAVPRATVAVLNRAINTAVSDTEYRSAVGEFGVTLIGGTPEHLTKFLVAERAKFAELIKKQNIKAN